jgi:hypothetical protein
MYFAVTEVKGARKYQRRMPDQKRQIVEESLSRTLGSEDCAQF